jgi:phosphoglycolate phosphatase-like HAD superfamily hydrolase
MNTKEEIKSFKPVKEFFIGIDSDGTAFDSMNIKHIKSMYPAAAEIWDAGDKKAEFEETWNRINLYSKSRGINRFLGLLGAFEELREKGGCLPDPAPLREYAEKNEVLSYAALKAWAKEHPAPLFNDIMRWSERSDELFEEHTKGILPFANVKDCLALMTKKADIMVVSSASGKGLDKDWSFSGLTEFTTLIAGQEAGSKKAQLEMGAGGKYPQDKILMIGDAPGDLDAARHIKALFYPVMPGKEEESWLFLRNEGLNRFFEGNYRGAFEDKLIKDFLGLLG